MRCLPHRRSQAPPGGLIGATAAASTHQLAPDRASSKGAYDGLMLVAPARSVGSFMASVVVSRGLDESEAPVGHVDARGQGRDVSLRQ